MNRYDGAVMTQYRHDPKNPNSPSGDYITDVLEDKQGSIWFSSPGLNKFDPSTGKFTRYRPANLPETKNDPFHISRLHQDRHGFLWLATHGRILYRFDIGRESFTEFDIGIDRPNEPQLDATSIQQDNSGIIWIGTGVDLSELIPLQEMSVFISDRVPEIRSLKLCMHLLSTPAGHSLSLTTTA